MIVLDASVVIAHLWARDAHHERATEFFRSHVDDEFLVHPLTLAEILVGPMCANRGEFAQAAIDSLGIREWEVPAGSAGRLARMRVDTAAKMPDCCVLEAASVTRSPVATLDRELAAAAASVGVTVLDLG